MEDYKELKPGTYNLTFKKNVRRCADEGLIKKYKNREYTEEEIRFCEENIKYQIEMFCGIVKSQVAKTEEFWRWMMLLAQFNEHIRNTFNIPEEEELYFFTFGYSEETSDDHLYFIEAENGYIKIGRSNDVGKRFSSLKTSSPLHLTIKKVVNNKGCIEGDLHEKFSHLWVRGEWFKPGGDLLEYINKIDDGKRREEKQGRETK